MAIKCYMDSNITRSTTVNDILYNLSFIYSNALSLPLTDAAVLL